MNFAGSLSGEMALLCVDSAYRGSSSLAFWASCQTLVSSSWGRVKTEMQVDARFVTWSIPLGAGIPWDNLINSPAFLKRVSLINLSDHTRREGRGLCPLRESI